jgi:hypothetical protein
LRRHADIKPSFLNDHPREHVNAMVVRGWEQVKASSANAAVEDIPEWTYQYGEGRQNKPTRSSVHASQQNPQRVSRAPNSIVRQNKPMFVPAPNARGNVNAPNSHSHIQDKIRNAQLQNQLQQRQQQLAAASDPNRNRQRWAGTGQRARGGPKTLRGTAAQRQKAAQKKALKDPYGRR